MRLRTVVFWVHLATGVSVGLVVLVMSATGVLLAFEPQIVAWAERDLLRVTRPAPDARPLPLADLVARAREARGGAAPVMVGLRAEPDTAVRVSVGRDDGVFVDPYTGTVRPGSRTHAVMHVIEDWHRWLGSRDWGKPVTGACNLAFLFLACSGVYLWWPRAWSRSALRAVTVPGLALHGRARDFNWHNSAGFWCAPVIVVLTLTGVVMSYQWANDLLYTLTGSPPPPAPGGSGAAAGARRGDGPRDAGERRGRGGGALDLDALRAATEQKAPPGWVALTLRMPQRPGGPVTAIILEPAGWHPSPRSTLTLDAATARVVRWEPYAAANPGRTLRVWVRVLHTGEAGRVPGQIVAGLASLGGTVLVWTGLSLAWRRFRAFTRPASQTRPSSVPSQPDPRPQISGG